MAEKSFNTRIVHKHDIEANWQLAVNFTPKQGELIVYDIDENYSYQRLKIGDGTSNVNDLPFMSEKIELDTTLTQEGMAADAKTVGDMLVEKVTIDLDGALSGKANLVNADTLGGKTENELSVAKALDSDTLGGHDSTYYAKVNQTTPRNLLDNSDFRNPVNSKNVTTIVLNNSVYQTFLDRWFHVDWSTNDTSTLTLTSDGIAVTNEVAYFYQKFKKGILDSEKTYTLGVYYSDGTMEARLRYYPTFISQFFEDYDEIYFTIDSGKTISCVALYEGAYTIETMPEYQPKGYANELLACNVSDSGNVSGITLLWENASPTSEFAAQTVNLDLNGYSKIAILCLRGTDIENYIPLSMMEKEKTCIMREISSNGSSLLYRTRSYIFNNTGVTFTKGESISSSGTSTTNNAILIPIKIYGIK